jgi:hypothetical protein
MTRQGSNGPPTPVAFHVERYGRGERIRTSGPCLPNARPRPSHVDLWHFFKRTNCYATRSAPLPFDDQGSTRPSGPCLSTPTPEEPTND